MNLKLIITVLAVSALFLAGCSKKSGSSDKIGNRWYTKEQVTKGQELFANNCAVCHGQKAESTPNWRKKLSDGSYPPPPLNGTAHAWHHPLKALEYTVKNGGKPFGGKMPGFGNVLNEQEILDVIAYFQNFWDDEVYNAWARRNSSSN